MSNIKTQDELENEKSNRVRIKTQEELEKNYKKSSSRIKTQDELEEEYQNNRYFPTTQSKPTIRYTGVGKQSVSDSIRKRNEEQQAREDAIKLATQDLTAAERNQEDLKNLPEGAYDYVENNKKESTLNNIVYNMTKNSDRFKTINTVAALAKSNVSEMLQSEYGMDKDKADYYEENWDTINETKKTNDFETKKTNAVKSVSDEQYSLLEKLAKAKDIYEHPSHEIPTLTYKQAKQYIQDIPETLKSQYGMSDDEINEYAEYVNQDANKKNYEATQEKMQNLVEEHPVLGRAGLSALSFATNIKGGFDAFVATAENKLTNKDSDTPIDPYSAAYEGTNLSNLAKSTVENSIDSTAGKYIYNAIQSSAESLPYFLIGGGVVEGIGLTGKAAETAAKLISYPLFSSSAFGSAFVQKKQQGMSDKQAFIYSVSAGAAEAISEELGFDGMFKVVSGKVTGKELAKLFAKNGIAEGLEEISSDIWNTIADQIINGDYSDLSMDIYNLENHGYSEEEAKKIAAKNLVMQYIEDGIVGALSGLIFTGVGVGTTKIGYHNLSKYASDETVQNAADTALNSETAKGSTAREIAEQMAANNQTASDLSTRQKAQMFESLAGLQDEEIDNSINKALESRIDNQDTIDKAKSLFDEYRNSNMTDKQFEERVVNEVAKNNQERDAILEARDEAFTVNKESNPIVNAVNNAATDKKISSYSKAVEKQTAKEQKEVEKRYNQFTKAEEQGKSSKEKYSKLKGVTQVVTKDGTTTKIKGIGKVAGANTTVVLEDGKSVKYTDLQYSDEKMGKLYNEVSSLPSTQLANIVIDNYSGEMNVEGYVRAVRLAYTSGQLSKSTNQTLDSFIKNMNNSNLLVNVTNMSAIKEAYVSGANSVSERKLSTKASKVTNKQIEKAAEENAKADDNLALTKAATGLALKSVIETKQYITNNHNQIVEAIAGAYSEGTTQLKAEGKNVYRTLIHENIAEKLKAENPEGYMEVADSILKYQIETNGNEYVINQLQRYGIEYTLADGTGEIVEVSDEYVNDCIAGLFSTPTGTQSYVDYVVSKLPEKAQKILGTLKEIAEKLIEEISKYLDTHKYMTAGARDGYQMAEENAVKIRDLIKSKLDEIDKNNTETIEEQLEKLPEKESFSVDVPVEKTKDLIAVHNLYEDKLIKALKYDGLPMPSIAITKASIGHTNFGEISFVFGRDTIDPKKNKNNKIYAADAWTPTFPRIEYEANFSEIRRVKNDLSKYFNNVPEMYRNNAESFFSGLEYNLDNYGGVEGVVDRALRDISIKQLYLAQTGDQVEPVTHEVRKEMTQADKEISEKMLDAIGKDNIVELASKSGKDILNQYGYAIKQTLIDYFTSDPNIDEALANEIVNDMKPVELVRYFRHARDYSKNNGIDISQEYSYSDTMAAVDAKIDEAKYKEWLEDTFKDIVSDTGIYNGKDIFTPSGNRRSFKATHFEINAENIVKAMIAQNDGNIRNTSGFYGAKTVRAAAVDEFKSIPELKKNSNKLQNLTEEEFEANQKVLDDRLSAVMNDIIKASNRGRDSWNEMDSLGYSILDVALNPTVAKIRKELETYSWKVTDIQAQEIVDIINAIKEMPVNMFEAKPLRVVDFNEGDLIIPDNASQKLKDALNEKNIPYLEYEAGNQEARKALVNSLDSRKFSVEVNGNEYDYLGDVLGLKGHAQLMSEISTYPEEHFEKASNGDLIIPVNNMFVYAKVENHDVGISSIIIVNSNDATRISNVGILINKYMEKGVFNYEQMRRIVERFTGKGSIRRLTNKDFGSNRRYDWQVERGQSRSDSYHLEKQQNRKEFHFGNERAKNLLKRKSKKQIDNIYFKAINDNEMSFAGDIVAAYAEKQGYDTKPVYVSNTNDNKSVADTEDNIIYATDDIKLAKEKVSKDNDILTFYSKTNSFYKVDANKKSIDKLNLPSVLQKYGKQIGKFKLNILQDYSMNDIAEMFNITKDYDGVVFENVNDNGIIADYYAFFNKSDIKSADTITYDNNGDAIPLSERFDDEINDTRFSVDVDSDQYAPVFYSKMENEISGIKTDKIGAASLIPYLKGKGVKDEEIKWSGIQTFLEGKKSVTKAELQEFLKANELVLEEETFDSKTQNEMENLESKLIKKAEEADFYYSPDDYIEEMDGSFRYSKLIEDIEEAFNDDQISKEDESSLLSIANEMRSKSSKAPHWSEYKTDGADNYREILFKIPKSDYTNRAMREHWNTKGVLAHTRLDDLIDNKGNKILFVEEIQSDWHNEGSKKGYLNSKDEHTESEIPEAPYKDGKYVEYVMKRLLRVAAAEGYDAVGWTTGKMQEDRWSSRFAEGYRIEYDQDIPKFMNKYGKQWGAKVEDVTLDNYDKDVVHAVTLTPEMKQSVLYQGQSKFSVDIPEYTLPDDYVFRYTSDEDLDKRAAEVDRQENIIKDFWKKIITQPDFTALRFRKEAYNGRIVSYILHHSTRPGVDYQLSYYDADGAIGHYNYFKSDMDALYNDLTGETLFEKDRSVEILPEDIETRSFSVEVDDDLSLFEAIIAENEEIKEAANVIKNTVQSMGNTKIKAADVKKIASSIKAEYKSNVSVDDIADSLTSVFNYMDQDNVNYDALVQIMSEIAKPILENATTTSSTRSENWDKFSSYLRGTKIKLSAGQIREVASEYGSYENYRKRLFGVTTISKDAPMSLDEMWSELVDASGNILPAAIEDKDQPIALLETIDGLRPQVVTENTYGMNLEQASYDLALDIYGKYFTAMANVNKAAEIQQAVGKVKAKQIANRRKAVETYKQKLEEQKKLLAAEKQKNIKALADEIKDANTDLEQAVRENNEIAAAVIEDLKNKNQKRIEQIRKQKDDQIAKIKAQNFDARKNERDRRKNTALKEQLRNQTNALNKMLKSPNIANFVKVSMVESTIDVLEAINLDTGKSKNMKEKLARLSELYARYRDTRDANGAPVFLGFDYDESTWQMIEDLRKTFEDRNYTELSNDELQKVVEIVIRLKTQIQNAGKLLQNEKYQDAFKTAKEIVGEIKDSDGSGKNRAQELMDDYFSVQLNAYRWFRKTSGYKDGAMMSIYKQLDDGQLKMISMQKEVNDMFTDLLEGEENQENVKRLLSTDDKDMVDIGLKVDGKTFKVPRGMLLHYLMSVQNEDNARHLVMSGFAVPDLELYAKGKYERAYKKSTIGQFYTFEDIKNATENISYNKKGATMEDGIAVATKRLQALSKKLRAQLTPWEEDYLERTEHLFHEYLGAKLNEVTVETRGYALAQVKNYYPINVDKKFTQTEFAGLKVDGTLEGMGFLKERVKASNPIILEDVASVILRQTNNTARYYGFAIPVRNLNMLMGIKKVDGYKNIESTLQDKWGTQNVKILKNIITDIQTGRKDDEILTKTMNALRGNFAAATLTANLGVGIKQTASIPTAIAVLGRKAVNKALIDAPKAFKGKGIEELEAINPLLWSRTNGNTSADLQYAQKSDIYKWMDNKLPSPVKTLTIDLIQYMDKSAVTTLEYASKYYVDENFKDLEKGSEEYWNKVSEMFTKTVEETQPNYTVLQRPEVLKTTNQLAKQLFMFKTQPMQNFGIVYDALGEYSAVKKKYAKGSAEYKMAADNLARAVGSQLSAALVFSLMTVLANVAYHKLWKYDQDDDKKWYWEVATAVTSGMASTLAGSLLCGDWVYNALSGLLFGSTNYGVEVSLVENLNNIYTYLKNYIEYGEGLANAVTEEKKETYAKKLLQNTEDVVYAAAEYLGVPAKNILNDITSPILYITELATDSPIGSLNMPWDNTPASQYQRMYEALLEGNTTRYSKLFEEQKKKALAEYAKKENQNPDYNPETGIKNKMKSMIKSDYDDGIITADEALKYLDAAGISYDSNIIDAWDYENETGNSSYTDYSRMKDAIQNSYENGADRSAITTEIKKLLKSGKDKGDIAKVITDQYKSIYLEKKTSSLKNLLITCYMACGYTREEAVEKIDKWSK